MQRIQSTESMPAASAVGFSMRMLMRKNRRVKWKCQTMGEIERLGRVYMYVYRTLLQAQRKERKHAHTRIYNYISFPSSIWYSQKPFLLFFLLRKRVCIEKRLLPIAGIKRKEKKRIKRQQSK
jgi:hypothetical protein